MMKTMIKQTLKIELMLIGKPMIVVNLGSQPDQQKVLHVLLIRKTEDNVSYIHLSLIFLMMNKTIKIIHSMAKCRLKYSQNTSKMVLSTCISKL